MKKLFLFLSFLLYSFHVLASNNCFIAAENGKIIKEEGPCSIRHSPCSTFKIALALMGFDSGILTSPNEPSIEFTKEAKNKLGSLYLPEKYPVMKFYERAHTPVTWMKYSVIWYSQFITEKLGMKRFQDYMVKLNYGNKDVSGDKGKNNGLLSSWIFSSIEISPQEQLDFIQKLITNSLPVSINAQENTKLLIKQNLIYDDWQLYGKTGGGMKSGWFVGWIEKDQRKISLAQYIEQPEGALLSSGRVAKEVAIDNLVPLMFLK